MEKQKSFAFPLNCFSKMLMHIFAFYTCVFVI